jgi:hypothetical protein
VKQNEVQFTKAELVRLAHAHLDQDGNNDLLGTIETKPVKGGISVIQYIDDGQDKVTLKEHMYADTPPDFSSPRVLEVVQAGEGIYGERGGLPSQGGGSV